MGVREQQKESRQQEILIAALDLFIKKGYAATRISDIAKACNMSMGLLFHYYESKENLYLELVKIGLAGTQHPLKQEYTDPIKLFEQFTLQLFEAMKAQPYVAKVFVLMAQAQRDEEVHKAAWQLAMQVDTIEQFVPIIEEGQRMGSIRQGNARALSNAYWCSIQGIAEQYALHPEIPLPEADWIVAIVAASVKEGSLRTGRNEDKE